MGDWHQKHVEGNWISHILTFLSLIFKCFWKHFHFGEWQELCWTTSKLWSRNTCPFQDTPVAPTSTFPALGWWYVQSAQAHYCSHSQLPIADKSRKLPQVSVSHPTFIILVCSWQSRGCCRTPEILILSVVCASLPCLWNLLLAKWTWAGAQFVLSNLCVKQFHWKQNSKGLACPCHGAKFFAEHLFPNPALKWLITQVREWWALQDCLVKCGWACF